MANHFSEDITWVEEGRRYTILGLIMGERAEFFFIFNGNRLQDAVTFFAGALSPLLGVFRDYMRNFCYCSVC